MEGRVSGGGGCCIARYGGHNNHQYQHQYHGPYYNPYDGSKMDRIMLRFRPIAPKPVVGEPNTKPASPPQDDSRKGKRKGNNNNNTAKRRKKSRSPSDDNINNNNNNKAKSNGCNKVTLPLLPETPDLSPRKDFNNTKSEPMWLCFGPSDEEDKNNSNPRAVDVLGSSVVVEGVTDTWMDGSSLGRTNEERKRRLDEDTCPGFISDGWNRVCWANKAYKRMVAGEDDTCALVMVKLGMREKVELPAVKLFPAFTCRVRVAYDGKSGTHAMTVPCDAWGMDGGGFAWRLDTKTALSLGL